MSILTEQNIFENPQIVNNLEGELRAKVVSNNRSVPPTANPGAFSDTFSSSRQYGLSKTSKVGKIYEQINNVNQQIASGSTSLKGVNFDVLFMVADQSSNLKYPDINFEQKTISTRK